jgi:hypothetical protein
MKARTLSRALSTTDGTESTCQCRLDARHGEVLKNDTQRASGVRCKVTEVIDGLAEHGVKICRWLVNALTVVGS